MDWQMRIFIFLLVGTLMAGAYAESASRLIIEANLLTEEMEIWKKKTRPAF